MYFASSATRFYVRTMHVPVFWRDGRVSSSLHSAPPPVEADASRPSATNVSYVVVEGCMKHLGCTVIIRGHPADVVAAKRAMRYSVYVAVRLF